jgi:hypothetical protein
LGYLDAVGKTTSETEQAMTAYLGDDGVELISVNKLWRKIFGPKS